MRRGVGIRGLLRLLGVQGCRLTLTSLEGRSSFWGDRVAHLSSGGSDDELVAFSLCSEPMSRARRENETLLTGPVDFHAVT